MQLNNGYIYRKFGDTYYVIGAAGGSFKLQNRVSCLMFEAMLNASSLSEARERFVDGFEPDHRVAAGAGFDKVAWLCNVKYSIFCFSDRKPNRRYVESDIFQELYRKAGEPSRVTQCHIELTDRCNFKCSMCYLMPITRQQGGRALNAADFTRILGLLEADGLIELTLTGGEPFANPEVLEILRILEGRNIFVIVNTNGSILTDELLEALRRIRVGSIEISVYGFSENEYEKVTGRRALARVLANAERLKAAGLPVRLKYTLQQDNAGGVRAFKTYCLRMGMPHVITRGILMPDVTGGCTPARGLPQEEIEKLCLEGVINLPEPSKTCSVVGCRPAKSRLTIDPSGDVFPCENLRLRLGNLLTGNTSELLGPGNRRLAAIAAVPAPEDSACAACQVKMFCSAKACPAAMYAVHGRLAGRYEPACRQAALFDKIRNKMK